MTKIAVVKCILEKTLDCSKEILKNFEKHNWVYLAPPKRSNGNFHIVNFT